MLYAVNTWNEKPFLNML